MIYVFAIFKENMIISKIQNFEKCFKFDPSKICLNYFSWMNSIQALYHFPSLGTAVDFSIVRLEIHKTQVIFRLSFLSFIVKVQSLLKHELSANLNGWCVSLQVYRLSNGFAKIWQSFAYFRSINMVWSLILLHFAKNWLYQKI